MNKTKSKKEKSIDKLNSLVVKIRLESIEANLNRRRDILIKQLKSVHDESIISLNKLFGPLKQLNHLIGNYLAKFTIQKIKKIFQSKFKLSTDPYTPKLIHFIDLKYSNAFSNPQMVKYIQVMPTILQELKFKKNYVVPFDENKFLEFSIIKERT